MRLTKKQKVALRIIYDLGMVPVYNKVKFLDGRTTSALCHRGLLHSFTVTADAHSIYDLVYATEYCSINVYILSTPGKQLAKQLIKEHKNKKNEQQ